MSWAHAAADAVGLPLASPLWGIAPLLILVIYLFLTS